MLKLALSFLLVALAVAGAQAQVVPQPGPPMPTACAYNTSPVTLTNGQAGWVQCNADGSAKVAPTGATTTTATSTISVTNTFQAALASSASRKSCLLQNTGANVEYIYFGTIGSATTSNSFQIQPLQTISCAIPNGVVLTDAVNITGTAGDGYVVANQ